MDKGKVQIYYGIGQGKSSAALGNAIRAASNGANVQVITFLKTEAGGEYLSRLEPEVRFFRFERSPEGFDSLSEEAKQDERQNIQNGFSYAKKVLTTEECDFLVLDEVLGTIHEGMATEEDVLTILSARSPFTTVILTGRELPQGIARAADEIYEIVPRRSLSK